MLQALSVVMGQQSLYWTGVQGCPAWAGKVAVCRVKLGEVWVVFLWNRGPLGATPSVQLLFRVFPSSPQGQPHPGSSAPTGSPPSAPSAVSPTAGA